MTHYTFWAAPVATKNVPPMYNMSLCLDRCLAVQLRRGGHKTTRPPQRQKNQLSCRFTSSARSSPRCGVEWVVSVRCLARFAIDTKRERRAYKLCVHRRRQRDASSTTTATESRHSQNNTTSKSLQAIRPARVKDGRTDVTNGVSNRYGIDATRWRQMEQKGQSNWSSTNWRLGCTEFEYKCPIIWPLTALIASHVLWYATHETVSLVLHHTNRNCRRATNNKTSLLVYR